MALSLDDRLLGEKMDNYCSSSEDEDGDEKGSGDDGEGASRQSATGGAKFIPEPELKAYNGRCTNTGPKGVINDWRRFKQLEAEKREEQDREKLELLKKLSITCRSHLDDDKEKKKDEDFMSQLEELEDMEDEFIKEYRQRRIEEMRKAVQALPKFGKVVELDASSYVESIDKEHPSTTVIVHIYEESVAACEAMNGCLMCLATEYPTVKFCKLKASSARLSLKFAENGVPALLIYKHGDLIGNFVGLAREFGEDFFATDIESFLQEYGFLPAQEIVNSVIRQQQGQQQDSDFELD
ncbi:phosducin-like protein isoform X1 [Lingula anatina]|uniref:Phosducin-like protein isoform X1 n=1 Tax=Lingula anatina TaxID=7574 RepID=A0A1S3K3Z6_LINAN|nr:phosducin-like protein isoform X1 [Lingula anatina]|eukprot:XP_013417350.1 phosducin-like protein isoform X1 [Lingula anatina]